MTSLYRTLTISGRWRLRYVSLTFH